MSETHQSARRWLADKTPAEVDRALVASLAQSLGVALNVEREMRFPEGRKPYSVAVRTGATAPSKANIERAIQRVEAAMTPPSRSEAEQMIGQLSAATAMRVEGDDVSDVRLELYVECLLRHPADVAREAIRWFAMEPKPGVSWFPTLAEVEGRCRDLENDRLSFLDGLKRWSEPDPAEVEVRRLESEFRRLRAAATEAKMKVGPGPASDTGARGERIEAARVAEELSGAAKQAWLAAEKDLTK